MRVDEQGDHEVPLHASAILDARWRRGGEQLGIGPSQEPASPFVLLMQTTKADVLPDVPLIVLSKVSATDRGVVSVGG